ncbi:MAG: nucleotidyltransferase domain-containing protein [Phycisphaerae bacterium]|jgi:predicted nucleotidyltransferase
MVHKTAVEGVRKYLNRLSETGLPVSFGVIFGSYATGRANQYSDIDLVVVSSDFDKIITRDSINKLWQIAARIDSRIEPIPCGWLQWQNDRSSAIIEIARTEGQTVSVN